MDPTKELKLDIYQPTLAGYKLKMLIYGPPGVGKTTFAATANMHDLTKEVLFVNIEGGMLSIADTSKLGMKDPPKVTNMTSMDQLDAIFWYLAKGGHPFKSVCVDSLSELQLVNLDFVVNEQMQKKDSKRESADDIWQDDYGRSTQFIRRVVRRFRDLPMHVFFTCHDASSQDDKKVETIHPALTPKLRTAVLGYMDVVGYLYMTTKADSDGKDVPVRRMLCRPYSKWIAKDRSPGGKLGTYIDNPTVPILIDKIISKGEVTK